MRKLIPLFGLLFLAPLAYAAPCSNTSLGSGIICVQSASNTAQAAGSISQAFGVNNTAGNLIIIAVGIANPPVADVSCTDTQGNTYHLIDNATFSSSSTDIMCYAENVAAGANTVTVALASGTSDLDLAIAEYSGLTMSGSFDVLSSSAGQAVFSGNFVNSGDIISTAAIELQFSFAYDQVNNTDTFTPSAGFTLREQTSNAGVRSLATFDKVVTSTGTYSNSVSINNDSVALHVILAGFKTTSSTLRNCTNSVVGGGITCIRATDTWGQSTTSITATYTNGAGHFLLYICGSSATAITLTDNNSNTITTIDTVPGIVVGVIKWSYVANSNAGSNTVTCTTDMNAHMNLIVAEYSGIALITPLDATNKFALPSAGTSINTDSITPAAPGRLLLAAVYNHDNSSSYLPDSGFAPEHTSTNWNPYGTQCITFGDRYVSAIGTYSTTWNGSRGRLIAMIAGVTASTQTRHKAVIY